MIKLFKKILWLSTWNGKWSIRVCFFQWFYIGGCFRKGYKAFFCIWTFNKHHYQYFSWTGFSKTSLHAGKA